MADNGNRGPNDAFRRTGKRRREPPIIDGTASEVPADASPAEDVSVTGAAEGPLSGETGPVAETSAAETRTPASPEAEAGEPAPPSSTPQADPVTPLESDEPVLFGSAMRDPARRSEAAVPSEPIVEPGEPAPSDAAGTPEGIEAGGSAIPPTSTFRADEPPPPGPTAAPSSAAGRPGNPLVGVLGVAAVVLLGIIGWLVYSGGQRGTDQAAAVADLKTRVASLEARPDPTALQNQLTSLEKRVAAAESDRAALGKQVAALAARVDGSGQPAQAVAPGGSPAPPSQPAAGSQSPAAQAPAAAGLATVAALTALGAKVDGLEGRLAALSAEQAGTAKAVAALPKPVQPDFGPVTAKIATLESEVNAADAKVNASDARFNAVDARINGVDAKVIAFGTGMNAFNVRMNALEAKVDDGAAQTAKLQTGLANLPKVDLGPLQATDAALDARMVKIETALSAPKDGARVTEARAVGSAAESRATPVAVVAGAVQRAIVSGKPYDAEIAALRALGADPALVARLGPGLAGGVPSAEALAAQWDGVRGQVLATVRPVVPGAGGPLNRFLAGATSIVKVRQVGAVEGDSTSAIVSQIDAALAQGDVPAALAAWDKLPDVAKTASRPWDEAARSRVDALAAAGDLVQGAIATLGRSAN